MGISGLLPCLKSVQRSVNIREYAGMRVAVDGYCWLHRGAYSCSKELCLGQHTTRYVDYCVRLARMLVSCGVEPLVVFDGGKLPMKEGEEGARRRGREEARDKATRHLRAGNMAAANECFQRAVDITPAMAAVVIAALKNVGISSLVAPYEADAQMAYLALTDHVQAVITEDSDLLAYGVPKVLFKMDWAGNGMEIRTEEIRDCSDLNLRNFTQEDFLQMCILSGCDYLPSVPGIGVKRAHAFLTRFRTTSRVVRALRMEGYKVPAEYEARFREAVLCFRHHWVFCPEAQSLVHLHPIQQGIVDQPSIQGEEAHHHLEQGGLGGGNAASTEERSDASESGEGLESLLGVKHSPELARGIARGDLDPITLHPFTQLVPSTSTSSSKPPFAVGRSSSSPRPRSAPRSSSKPLPAQKNTISSYFSGKSSEVLGRPFSAPRPSSSSRSPSSTTPATTDSPVPHRREPHLFTPLPHQSASEPRFLTSPRSWDALPGSSCSSEPPFRGHKFERKEEAKEEPRTLLPKSEGNTPLCLDDDKDLDEEVVSPVKPHSLAWTAPIPNKFRKRTLGIVSPNIRVAPSSTSTLRRSEQDPLCSSKVALAGDQEWTTKRRLSSHYFASSSGSTERRTGVSDDDNKPPASPSKDSAVPMDGEATTPGVSNQRTPEENNLRDEPPLPSDSCNESLTSSRSKRSRLHFGSTAHCQGLRQTASSALDRLETATFEKFRCKYVGNSSLLKDTSSFRKGSIHKKRTWRGEKQLVSPIKASSSSIDISDLDRFCLM